MSRRTDPAGDPTRGPAGDLEGADVGLLTPGYAGTAAEALTGDVALIRAMVAAEVALLSALVDTGLAPAAAAEAAGTLATTSLDPRDLALAAVAGGNPVIGLVERLRSVVPADVAPWVHHGATSQDILDTALMLVASDVVARAEADLLVVADWLADLCGSGRSVPMVARTLTQQALPTTLGMRAAGWLAGVHDALLALRTCTTLPVSLGGPVGTASAYGARGPAVLDAFARALGQRAAVGSWHTRRTPVVGLGTALTVTGGACGKIAADLLVMTQTEVGEAREGSAGGSSSMPHKANPAGSVLVAAAARQLPALGSVLAASMSAEQERPAGAWHAEWQPLRTMLRLAGGAAERSAAYLPSVVFDQGALERNLTTLLIAQQHDPSWAAGHVEHVGVWIDRVLAQHREVCG